MRLSIIVPIYNVEKYLCRCVDSILAQTFTDFELILVDDGSPDGCPAICDGYALKDPRIRVIHKANGGLSDARNAGIDVAQGEYLAFVDSDDWIEPDMYQSMIDMLELHDADMVACGITQEREDGTITGRWPPENKDKIYFPKDYIDDFYPDVRRDILPAAWNKVYRRKLFQTIRYPKGKIYEDAFIQLPLYDGCSKIAVCGDAYYHYIYDRSGSIQNDDYSLRRLHLIEFNLEQYRFFVEKDIPIQQQYVLGAYLNRYIQNHLAIHIFHKEHKKALIPYTKTYKKLLTQIIANPKICKLKKCVALLVFVNSTIAYRICKKYFPECLPETINH